jgi:hypothetical protein
VSMEGGLWKGRINYTGGLGEWASDVIEWRDMARHGGVRVAHAHWHLYWYWY